MGYRTRITATKRLADGLSLSQSIYPNIPAPRPKGLLIAFVTGGAMFLIAALVLLALSGCGAQPGEATSSTPTVNCRVVQTVSPSFR